MYPPLLAIATSYRTWEEGTQNTVTNQQVIAGRPGASGNTGSRQQTEKTGNLRARGREPRVFFVRAVLGPSSVEDLSLLKKCCQAWWERWLQGDRAHRAHPSPHPQ